MAKLSSHQLHDLASNILELQQKTDDPVEKKTLRRQLMAVLEDTEVLIRANLNAANAQYQKATAGLDAANKAVGQALEDLSKVAKTIETIAKVVDVLGKLAAMAAKA
jgi:hypothetical protein